MITSIILDTYASMISALGSSHRDEVYKIAFLFLLPKMLKNTSEEAHVLVKLQAESLQSYSFTVIFRGIFYKCRAAKFKIAASFFKIKKFSFIITI